MASFTFGSLGDILTLTGLAISGMRALSESDGSAADYQSLEHELLCLQELLDILDATLNTNTELKHTTSLVEILERCKTHLEKCQQDFEQFKTSLGSNASDKKAKRIYKKIRWLSKKKDVAAFRDSIATYVRSISAILTLSGIDAAKRLQQVTTQHVGEGNVELLTALNQTKQQQICDKTDILAAVDSGGRKIAILVRNSDDLARSNHADLTARFERLELTISESKRADTHSEMTVVNMELLEAHRFLLRQLFHILFELSRLGLRGAYTLLQLLCCYLAKKPTRFGVQGRYFKFEDALQRSYMIDWNFMSYNVFNQLIEENFRSGPGSSFVKRHQYHFEDIKQNMVDLQKLWDKDCLNAGSLFMRIRVSVSFVKRDLRDSMRCACGLPVKTLTDQFFWRHLEEKHRKVFSLIGRKFDWVHPTPRYALRIQNISWLEGITWSIGTVDFSYLLLSQSPNDRLFDKRSKCRNLYVGT